MYYTLTIITITHYEKNLKQNFALSCLHACHRYTDQNKNQKETGESG